MSNQNKTVITASNWYCGPSQLQAQAGLAAAAADGLSSDTVRDLRC